jgi:hypothetical protein
MDKLNLKNSIVELYKARVNRGKTKAVEFAGRYGLEESLVRKLVGKISTNDALIFKRIICNGLILTAGLVRRGLIDERYRDRCAVCGKAGAEDFEHFVLECELLEGVRIKYYDLLLDVALRCNNVRRK